MGNLAEYILQTNPIGLFPLGYRYTNMPGTSGLQGGNGLRIGLVRLTLIVWT